MTKAQGPVLLWTFALWICLILILSACGTQLPFIATATPSPTPTFTQTPIPTSTFTPSPTPTPDIALLLPEIAAQVDSKVVAMDGAWVWLNEAGKPVASYDPDTREVEEVGEYLIGDGEVLWWTSIAEGEIEKQEASLSWGWFEVEALQDLGVTEVIRGSDGAAVAIGEQGLPVARQEVGLEQWQEVNWYQVFTVEQENKDLWIVSNDVEGEIQEIGVIERKANDFSVQFAADSIQSFIEYQQVPQWNASQVQVEPETGNLWLMKLSEKTDKYYKMFAFNPETREMEQILYENPATIFWKDESGRDKPGIEKGLVNLYIHPECPDGDCSFAFVYLNRVFGYRIGEMFEDENYNVHFQIGMVFDKSEFLIPVDAISNHGPCTYLPQAVFEPVKEIDPSQRVLLNRDNIEEYIEVGTPLVFQHMYVSYEDRIPFLEKHSAIPNFIRRVQIHARKMGKDCYDVETCVQIEKEWDRNIGLTQEMAEALKAAYEQGKYPDSPLFFTDFPQGFVFLEFRQSPLNLKT